MAFVGDGVNDVIAMKKAEVSISLSGATTIATDVAQIVLMDGTLSHLPYLLELSSGLDRNLKRSLAINVIPSAVTLSGVLFFKFSMLTSVLVSQSPLVLGTANALIPFDLKRKEIDEACEEAEDSGDADKSPGGFSIEEKAWLSARVHALRSWATYPGTLYRRSVTRRRPGGRPTAR